MLNGLSFFKSQKGVSILFSFVFLGLLASFPALGAIPSNSQLMTPPSNNMMQVYGTRVANPCVMSEMGTSGTKMTSENFPCDEFGHKGVFFMKRGGNQAVWYELMFILTVMLVWAVLLLLIAVLWKQLKKHKS